LISSKEVGIVKGACYSRRTFFNGKGGS
jgi:hypothetical protein